jgi:Pvc16 N-terminal domain
MSNFLAIATVTAALSQTLRGAVETDVPGASVTTLRPDAAGNGIPATRVNLYLYQVTANATWRNADLPTRNSDGQLMQRPQVALDLHYLLNFYGDEGQLEPQRLMGSAVRTLHALPLLTRQMIRSTIANPAFLFLTSSNLADAIELVKFTPLPLSLEELSKLWSVFFQTTYTLSIAYQGTVVLIESDTMPRATLPVRARNLYVVPFRQPVIEQVMSQAGADQPIVMDSTLVIRGQQLRGEVTLLRVGSIEVTPAPQNVTDTQISLPADLAQASPPLSGVTLRAGVQAVQVIHQLLMGTPPVPHRGVESNVAAFVLRPTIVPPVTVANVQGSDDAPRSAELTMQVEPPIGNSQRVTLLMNAPSSEGPAAYSFVVGPRTADVDAITIPISEVRPGDYLVRVQVDGSESPLLVDTDPNSPTFNQFLGPLVTIP